MSPFGRGETGLAGQSCYPFDGPVLGSCYCGQTLKTHSQSQNRSTRHAARALSPIWERLQNRSTCAITPQPPPTPHNHHSPGLDAIGIYELTKLLLVAPCREGHKETPCKFGQHSNLPIRAGDTSCVDGTVTGPVEETEHACRPACFLLQLGASCADLRCTGCSLCCTCSHAGSFFSEWEVEEFSDGNRDEKLFVRSTIRQKVLP